MISLNHLPLTTIVDTHAVGIEKWAKVKRFDPIFSIYEEFYLLRNEPLFPKSSLEKFKVALGEKKKEKLLIDFDTIFSNKVLIGDFYEIFKLVRNNWTIILKGTPDKFDDLISLFEPYFSKYRYYDSKGKLKYQPPFQVLLNYLEYVFDYESKFLKKEKGEDIWDAYRLAEKLGVEICPYCNRQYTSTIIFQDKSKSVITYEKIIRPEFDHFYPKSKCPYLALSFYNLVPSCKICNSSLKGTTEMDVKTYIHPYMGGFEKILKFRTGITLENYLKDPHLNISIKLEGDNNIPSKQKDRSIQSANLFKLEKIYGIHAENAREIFKKSVYNSTQYLDNWYLKSPHGSRLFKDTDDLYLHYIGSYMGIQNMYKRPLSKFQFDIAEETGLIAYIEKLK